MRKQPSKDYESRDKTATPSNFLPHCAFCTFPLVLIGSKIKFLHLASGQNCIFLVSRPWKSLFVQREFLYFLNTSHSMCINAPAFQLFSSTFPFNAAFHYRARWYRSDVNFQLEKNCWNFARTARHTTMCRMNRKKSFKYELINLSLVNKTNKSDSD